jgi:hypothetical protein
MAVRRWAGEGSGADAVCELRRSGSERRCLHALRSLAGAAKRPVRDGRTSTAAGVAGGATGTGAILGVTAIAATAITPGTSARAALQAVAGARATIRAADSPRATIRAAAAATVEGPAIQTTAGASEWWHHQCRPRRQYQRRPDYRQARHPGRYLPPGASGAFAINLPSACEPATQRMAAGPWTH